MQRNKKNTQKRVARRKNAKNPDLRIVGVSRSLPSRRAGKIISVTTGACQAAAAGFCVCDFRLNDPTNGGLSGGTGGFSTTTNGLMDFDAYAQLRVKRVGVEVAGSSLETGANISVFVCFSDTQISTRATTYALAQACAVGMLSSRPRLVAPITGNSAFTLPKISVTPLVVAQDPSTLDDTDYLVTINPAHVAPVLETWGAVIVLSAASGINLTNGLDITLKVIYHVDAKSRLPER